ncbi:MAG: hypothetical protein DMF61_01995 [Blastocatellia bacterium AA13]|nr:MAG: hypothetical protein DMF61_01995 [Blastocatellia bacterium AA13]
MKQISAKKTFLISLAVYVGAILIIAVAGYCFGSGDPSEVSRDFAAGRLQEFHQNAFENSKLIMEHNLSVSLRLLALQLLPLFGVILASGNLGLSLGLLLKSVAVASVLPPLSMLMLVLPHGVPEYAGFILMQNSVTNIYLAGFLRMFKIRVDLKRAGLLSGASLLGGMALVIIAAIIEGYGTPAIAERLLHP